MPDISTGTTAIKFGSNLKIGYRVSGSSAPFTYLNFYPEANNLPYTFTVPSTGAWEVEYTEICTSCSGNNYSEPLTAIVTLS